MDIPEPMQVDANDIMLVEDMNENNENEMIQPPPPGGGGAQFLLGGEEEPPEDANFSVENPSLVWHQSISN